MLDVFRRQSTTQITHGIMRGAAGCDCVSKHLTGALLGTVSSLNSASALNLAKDTQEIRRGNGLDGSITQLRKQQLLKGPSGLVQRGGREALL